MAFGRSLDFGSVMMLTRQSLCLVVITRTAFPHHFSGLHWLPLRVAIGSRTFSQFKLVTGSWTSAPTPEFAEAYLILVPLLTRSQRTLLAHHCSYLVSLSSGHITQCLTGATSCSGLER